MPTEFDLLVIGDANPDVILGPLDEPLAFGQREQLVPTGTLTIGGSGAITACGAARLGLKVAIAGRVGADDAGEYLRSALSRRGVNVDALHADPEHATALTAAITRGEDRAILTATGALAATDGDDVPRDLVAASRHVHLASYFLLPGLRPVLPDIAHTARAGGATVSLDTNDDPSRRWDRRQLDPLLERIDVVLPNAEEARALAGVDGPVDEAARRLAAKGPLVVVKNGAEGALCQDGSTAYSTRGQTVSPVDAIGAGDSFDAGFIAARLRGLALADALELAAACGALSTRARGGTTAQPTWDQASTHLTNDSQRTA